MSERCPTCGHILVTDAQLTNRELDVLSAWYRCRSVKKAAVVAGVGEQRAKNLLASARRRARCESNDDLALTFIDQLRPVTTRVLGTKKAQIAAREGMAHLRAESERGQLYDRLFDAQEGTCAICGAAPDKRRLAIDHNHQTGATRGLLCYSCNIMLGYATDDPERLRRAADYLDDHREAGE